MTEKQWNKMARTPMVHLEVKMINEMTVSESNRKSQLS